MTCHNVDVLHCHWFLLSSSFCVHAMVCSKHWNYTAGARIWLLGTQNQPPSHGGNLKHFPYVNVTPFIKNYILLVRQLPFFSQTNCDRSKICIFHEFYLVTLFRNTTYAKSTTVTSYHLALKPGHDCWPESKCCLAYYKGNTFGVLQQQWINGHSSVRAVISDFVCTNKLRV